MVGRFSSFYDEPYLLLQLSLSNVFLDVHQGTPFLAGLAVAAAALAANMESRPGSHSNHGHQNLRYASSTTVVSNLR